RGGSAGDDRTPRTPGRVGPRAPSPPTTSPRRSSVHPEDHGAVTREDTAGAVHQGDLGALDLTRFRLAAELADGFHHEQEPVHTRVAVGEAAAVRVQREVPAGPDTTAPNEFAARPPLAEPQRLQGEEDGDREAVVDLDDVDVGGGQTGE